MASVDLTAYESAPRKRTQRERKTPLPCRFDFAAVPDLQRWIGRWGKGRAAAAARVSVDSLDKMTAGELVAFASVDRVRKAMGQPCPPIPCGEKTGHYRARKAVALLGRHGLLLGWSGLASSEKTKLLREISHIMGRP